jgi:hypothetical protein
VAAGSAGLGPRVGVSPAAHVAALPAPEVRIAR